MARDLSHHGSFGSPACVVRSAVGTLDGSSLSGIGVDVKAQLQRDTFLSVKSVGRLMMRHDVVREMIDTGAVGVIRLADAQKLTRVIDAVRRGGISTIEITMTTPDALGVIEEVTEQFVDDDELLVGVGSVLDGTTARMAINAGAQFVVGPTLSTDLVETSHRYDVPAIPGTFTPTEVSKAHERGADIVKVFPASSVGPSYFRALHGPLPHVKLMPTGGVGLRDAGDWIQAGACVVGVGSALFDEDAIAEEDYDALTESAEILRRSVDAARD